MNPPSRRQALLALVPATLAACTPLRTLEVDTREPPREAFLPSTPAEQGMDAARLDALRERLMAERHVRSVRVLRHDRQVFDYRRSDLSAAALHDVRSVTKSMLSTLVGIALGAGLLRGIDQPIHELLPEAHDAGVDARVREITLRHLLTMTAGFQWNEDTDWSRTRWAMGDNLQRTLRRPVAHAPGTHFNYDTESAHLLSIVLSRAVGMPTATYAERALFVPLGITRYHWPADAQGWHAGGHGLQLDTAALASVGVLMLHGGQWRGQPLVPADYVHDALRRQVAGAAPFPEGTGYGYLWWLLGLRARPVIPSASGYGGQWVHVAAPWDLVAVVTADVPWTGRRETVFVMRDYLVPAVQR